MPEEKARLQIGSYGDRTVQEVVGFAGAVEASHDGLLAFLNLLDRAAIGGVTGQPNPRAAVDQLEELELRMSKGGRPTTFASFEAAVARESMLRVLVPSDERLVVLRVQIASPGLWEFLGALNPLTFINDYLTGRHERRKDREYREQAERRRFQLENERRELENQLLETQVVQERLQLAQAVGLHPRQQQLLLDRLAIDPLLQLAEVAGNGMAFPASALDEEQNVDRMKELERAIESDRPDLPPPPLLN